MLARTVGGFGLRARLLAAFLAVTALTVAVGALSVVRMSAIADAAEQVYTAGTVPLDAIRAAETAYWTVQAQSARSQLTTLSPDLIAVAAKASEAAAGVLAETVASALDAQLSSEARTSFESF